MSARQFREPTLVQEVADILQSTGLKPSRLQLEVTESVALTIATTALTLKQLQALGVRISIDDFGTGYAALSHLQDLPVDIVKIDRSFVKGIEVGSVSEAIVLAIVNMAKALDFYVVAEGVETEAELQVIRQSRCHAVQGYYLCKPQPPQELEQRLAKGEPGFLPVTP
jgi:EAL domain-containing protein (putative c-di-GMP-specific phosphodiesterase class I)